MYHDVSYTVPPMMYQLTACEQAEKILYAALDPAMASKTKKGDFIRGTVDDVHQGEVCRSKAKGGTTHFFTYATAYAVIRGRR